MPALLTAQNCEGNVHLVVGSGPLAASRCAKALEVGARPVLTCPTNDDIHYTLLKLIEDGKVQWTKKEFQDDDLKTLGREEVGGFVDAVFVTHGPRHSLSVRVSTLCRKLRIPVNVVDAPQLCTFTLLSTYSDGPLQIGITTSGRGCKLSARIRREIAAALPPNFGGAIERLGTVRQKIWEEDQVLQKAMSTSEAASANSQTKIEQEQADLEVEDEDASNQKYTFNTLVEEKASLDPAVARTRRMRWLSQICEYWPLRRLAEINDADISAILDAYKQTTPEVQSASQSTSAQTPPIRTTRRGTITLAGSGPGHPSLLTLATHQSLQSAHYILADKLVPAEILALIPRRTPVHIARKFPGNADAAQEELLTLALAAMQEGKDVLRLKQGDPYLYGRGAEEVTFFRQHGYEARVLPGVTSALSAPLFAGIPVTHRAVADQVVVCTGTGRKGAAPAPPAYRTTKTVVFLMALHRLESLVTSLTELPANTDDKEPRDDKDTKECKIWPKSTPCAVIERASSPDQRIIRSTLQHINQAVVEEGSRPPGLLVVGAACTVLHTVPEGQRWTVEEGFRGLDDLSRSSTSSGGATTVSEMDMLQDIEKKNDTISLPSSTEKEKGEEDKQIQIHHHHRHPTHVLISSSSSPSSTSTPTHEVTVS